jgi:hypothetical protein
MTLGPKNKKNWYDWLWNPAKGDLTVPYQRIVPKALTKDNQLSGTTDKW